MTIINKIEQCKPQNISIFLPLQPPWLQRQTICPHWRGHAHPWEAEQEEDICPTLCQIMGIRPSNRALSMLGTVGYFIKRKTGFRHGVSQTQIYHKPVRDISRWHHCHNRKNGTFHANPPDPNMPETTVQALQRLEEILPEAAMENKFAIIKLTSATPPEQLL